MPPFLWYAILKADMDGGVWEVKIVINVNEEATDLEIAISCSRLTPEIERILATLRILEK